MEMTPQIVFMAVQVFAVCCIELIAMGIEEWQKEPDVPKLIQQILLPPFRSRFLFGIAYFGIAMVFFSGA